ncbi:MAG: MAPEG family protein [Hyphomicrobiales bacterium]
MILYILLTLALYKTQLFLEPCLRYITGGKKQMSYGLGARDKATEMSVTGGRLKRAAENLKESLPIFLALALLAVIKDISGGLMDTGALIFLVARVAYVPAYVTNFRGVRSLVWTVGVVGLVLMVVGLLQASAM